MGLRRRSAVAAATLLVVGALGAAGWLLWGLLRPGPAVETTLRVAEGAATREVLVDARERGLLPSVLAARLYLELAAGGREVRWGRYTFPPGVRPVDVLERLLAGEMDLVAVTVVEGSSVPEIVDTFVAAGLGDRRSWLELTRRTGWISGVAPSAPSLEGFLFPDTYRFAPGLAAERVARSLVDRFHRVWGELVAEHPPWASPLELVTLASLVEAETHLPGERALVAGVFRNRLERGMLLQCDPTVVYALERRGSWTGPLRRSDLLVDDPYNTYLYPGLPPGPINSPGRAALEAALAPAVTEALYFVARPGGGHTFSRTLAEHNRAVAELRRGTR